MNTIRTREGNVEIEIPDPKDFSRGGRFDPSWAPVFYNPRMKFNRDLAVLFARAVGIKEAADVMAGTGVRAIRYAVEGGISTVIANDLNSLAYDIIKRNVSINNLTNVLVHNRDAISLMRDIHTQLVDLDPFGSPSPFLIPAVGSVRRGGFLAITATDTAPLTGSAPASCARKYHSKVFRSGYSKEMGLRILVKRVIEEAAVLERAARPILSYYTDYYFRVYFHLMGGAKRADELMSEIGYIAECRRCGYVGIVESSKEEKCPHCGNMMSTSGPLYLGELIDREVVDKMLNVIKCSNEKCREKLLLETLLRESQFRSPYYWSLNRISSLLKINTPSILKVIECLGDKNSSRTHMEYQGLRTDLPYDEVLKCIKMVSSA